MVLKGIQVFVLVQILILMADEETFLLNVVDIRTHNDVGRKIYNMFRINGSICNVESQGLAPTRLNELGVLPIYHC